jgi:BirA family biotin operon repressor/biotin-[acetyl-CoA-carboxylase] ligase
MPIRLIQKTQGNFLKEIDSTNNWIKNPEIEPGSWVLADRQLAGKGRNGRVWNAFGEENIIFSAKLRLSLTDLPLTLISLFAGSALLRAIFQWIPQSQDQVRLKWPNDVLKENKKIAGILVETEVQGDQFILIIGLGLNLYSTGIPEDLKNKAGFLLDSPPLEGTKERLLYSFIDTFNQNILSLMDPIMVTKELTWIEKYCSSIGCPAVYEQGNLKTPGKIVALSNDGFLIFLSEDGMKHIFLDTDPNLKIFGDLV